MLLAFLDSLCVYVSWHLLSYHNSKCMYFIMCKWEFNCNLLKKLHDMVRSWFRRIVVLYPMLQNCFTLGLYLIVPGWSRSYHWTTSKTAHVQCYLGHNLLSLIIFRALPQSWSFPEASKLFATSGVMLISSWTRWRFSSDISAKESHRRSVCSSCSYRMVSFNCSGTSDRCARQLLLLRLSCMPDAWW